ncbi:hypothetical protein KVT40_007036 [Elsinoe batatas]|uniref:Uncharacterized protein n=1 Tax=Elsinoe batatas TaxID=2601811 RepID=A0A8K0L0L7_9PEZI|nr:hypothetical protein KVT40_007036 [Elsinoe batatas]
MVDQQKICVVKLVGRDPRGFWAALVKPKLHIHHSVAPSYYHITSQTQLPTRHPRSKHDPLQHYKLSMFSIGQYDAKRGKVVVKTPIVSDSMKTFVVDCAPFGEDRFIEVDFEPLLHPREVPATKPPPKPTTGGPTGISILEEDMRIRNKKRADERDANSLERIKREREERVASLPDCIAEIMGKGRKAPSVTTTEAVQGTILPAFDLWR